MPSIDQYERMCKLQEHMLCSLIAINFIATPMCVQGIVSGHKLVMQHHTELLCIYSNATVQLISYMCAICLIGV